LAEFLRDVDDYFGERDLTIEFTEKPSIKDELISAGWSDFDETVWLAHAGVFPATPPVDIERVGDTTLEQFARMKLQSFGETEDEPDASTLAVEMSMRKVELRGDGRGLLAKADGEATAMCAYYSGEDHFVFLLGTRIPFRGRGIASAVLHQIVDDAHASRARSVIINARAGGRPESLYKNLGFTDEVYRQWRFRSPS